MIDTLIVLQCCKKKEAKELYPDQSYDLVKYIPKTYTILQDEIERLEKEEIIDVTSEEVTALSLYCGYFYNFSETKKRIFEEIVNNHYQFLIISAGYGIVHPFQQIHKYDQEMRGRVTSSWIKSGLARVLEEYIEENEFKQVFGIFSKSSGYRKIFKRIDWNQVSSVQRAGFFYLDNIRGMQNVLEGQADLLLRLIENGFDIEKVVLPLGTLNYLNLFDNKTNVDMKKNIYNTDIEESMTFPGTNPDKIKALLAETPNLCDSCIDKKLGIHSHQQVQGICSRRANKGQSVREFSKCAGCGKQVLVNRNVEEGSKVNEKTSVSESKEEVIDHKDEKGINIPNLAKESEDFTVDNIPISKINESGQIIIPESIRDKMNYKIGDRLAFIINNGVLEIKKVRYKLEFE